MNKQLLIFLIVLVAVGCFYWLQNGAKTSAQEPGAGYAFTLSDEEWQQRLSPQAYKVLRHEATERPNTSPLNREKRPGEFRCAGCGVKLFDAAHKFDSGTGWPSFFQPDGDVASKTDYKLIAPRTEVHCGNCGGHLGHVFGDGPAPTGKRYCINGVSLEFVAKTDPE